MNAEKIVTEGLLAGAWKPRPQPVRIWDVVAIDDVNLGDLSDRRRRHHIAHGVENVETLVDGDLQDRLAGSSEQ